MTRTKQTWTKPELVKLGKIGEVAGSMSVNNNGININVKS